MEFRVQLDPNYCKRWTALKNGYVCGDCFLEAQYLTGETLAEAVQRLQTTAQAADFVAKLNGSFAVVLFLEESLFLAVDRQSTIPLFYHMDADCITIHNHLSLSQIRQYGLRQDTLAQLHHCLFVSGADTLAQNTFQVMAGQYVIFEASGEKKPVFYHSFHYEKKEVPEQETLFRQIDETFTHAAQRLIQVLGGRRAVIPLSGGHDSRLIVYYLKRLGYDNILTYTYGKKGNWESAVSRKVAEYLNVPWHCVEYVPKQLQKLVKKDFARLTDFYCSGVSSVCLQEWYAVDSLFRQGLLRPDDVFVPGHSFDAFAGSFLLPHYVGADTVTKQQLVKDVLRKHYCEGGKLSVGAAQAKLEEMLDALLLKDEPAVLSSEAAFDLYQTYNTRERQAKYICAAVRMYAFYGFDWYLPLWDAELIEFWEHIPNKIKYNRSLFFAFTEHRYGDLMQAAPVENLKSKEEKPCRMDPVSRVLRKLGQLIRYTDTHYCLGYFSRLYVYGVFLRCRTLNIGCMVNQKMIKLFAGDNT